MSKEGNTRKRARKGTGSIFPVYSKARGKTYYRAELEWTVDGHTEHRTQQFSTWAEADAQLKQWRIQRDTSGTVPTKKQRGITVAQAIESYKADASIGNRLATGRFHASITNSPLLTPLLPLRIASLRREDIRGIATSDVKSKRTGKPLSQRSRQAAHNFLKAALSRQPLAQARWIELFPPRSTPRSARREINLWSADEARTFLVKAKQHPLFALFALALGSGARQGELLGLKWRDVGSADITIARSYGPDDFETKNGTSRRRIDLDPTTVAILRRHRERLEAGGTLVGPNAWVFGSSTRPGKPTHSSTVSHVWGKLMEDLSEHVPTITFHDLRHTHASLLLKENVNVKVIQERLGHKSITITLDVYAHLIPTMQISAATVIGNVIWGIALNGNLERDAA